ncbi:DNA repair-scaffolding protein isoform X2 [Lampris incognitus]|uniref:DNA repair-scaffolding protein isoform X2 n=1 Tax=Lampris incognitus TaxID=2546036 RepID=UPI0024B4E635|nr:DNA repair-scaffolding protein isoform X2 [Lampris incognitus]
MSYGKRKRYRKHIRCVSFPDDVRRPDVRHPPVPQKVAREAAVSPGKRWRRWEDCFQDTPNLKLSGKKRSAARKLTHPPSSVRTSAADLSEDPIQIVWSSSDSELSNGDAQKRPPLPRTTAQQQRRPRRPVKPATLTLQSHKRALQELSTDKEDPLVIEDTDSDLNNSEDEAKKEGVAQISSSDTDSEPYDVQLKGMSAPPVESADLDISAYEPDEESADDTMTRRGLDIESFSLQTGEGGKRSLTDWVKAAQAALQTPQKQSHPPAKTPEDSAKKRRKFQSGGLAERLNRLQGRQRSAVGFWRHQSVSETLTAAVDMPGVLVLEVLEVQEECGMQLAQCEHRPAPSVGQPHSCPVSAAGVRVLVLFAKETAAQLTPAPRDIIHVYPPWQTLTIEGENGTIVLNTHFSQKVYSGSKLGDTSVSSAPLPAQKRMPYPLTRVFGLLEMSTVEDTAKQVAGNQALCCTSAPAGRRRHSDSLLEAIEGLGQAGSIGQDVVVVVQRVYAIPVPNRSAGLIIKSKMPCRSSSPPSLQKVKTRLCALVQDAFGMFSVVQLHLLTCEDHLQQYSQRWQGRTCVLTAIKVVQRVTRERFTRLFTVLDSLWPPVTSRQAHGNSPSSHDGGGSAGPPPRFCYLLSGQEDSVEPIEGQTVSPLYHPPVERTLQDILQREHKTQCFSFTATVIYKRMQSIDVGQREIWLVLTDPSLQADQIEEPCRRTLAVCVSTSCVLSSSVIRAFLSTTACRLSFRDVIKEHGVLLCVEQSVVQRDPVEPVGSLDCPAEPEPPLQSWTVSQTCTHSLPQPLRLDPLSAETRPNSLCTLSGVIVDVDESSAYSWPACGLCGNSHLEMVAERPQAYFCKACNSTSEKPTIKMHLEVFLSSSLANCTLKVKLQESTIMSILNTADCVDNEFPGYEVESVLGKEVGPLAVYVRVVKPKPALWISLEEVRL